MFGFVNFYFLTKLFKTTTATKSKKLPYYVQQLHYHRISRRLDYINMNSPVVLDFYPLHSIICSEVRLIL